MKKIGKLIRNKKIKTFENSNFRYDESLGIIRLANIGFSHDSSDAKPSVSPTLINESTRKEIKKLELAKVGV